VASAKVEKEGLVPLWDRLRFRPFAVLCMELEPPWQNPVLGQTFFVAAALLALVWGPGF
jgi:hypothetical protein